LKRDGVLDVGMQLVSAPLSASDPNLPEVVIRADRITLAKRLWRATAADGTEFGFELGAPLRHGEVVFQTPCARYVIQQAEEPVVEVALDLPPSAAAGIGWAIGNLHLELAAEPTRLIAADEPAVRQLLDRLKVPYRPNTLIFRPGRFSRGTLPSHDLGPGHKH
jgi:urease accessory protein